MSIELLLKELLEKIPEEAPIIRALVSKKDKGGLMILVLARVANYMNPEEFVRDLENKNIDSALATSKKAFAIKNLAFEIIREF